MNNACRKLLHHFVLYSIMAFGLLFMKLFVIMYCMKWFQDMKKVDTIDDVEAFLLKHGENIVDMLGGEIDRIELKLRVRQMSSIILALLNFV